MEEFVIYLINNYNKKTLQNTKMANLNLALSGLGALGSIKESGRERLNSITEDNFETYFSDFCSIIDDQKQENILQASILAMGNVVQMT